MAGVHRWFLVRHGETEWNRVGRAQGHADPPLNRRGRSQARKAAERLAGTSFQAVYVSDLQRALDTAKPIIGAGQDDRLVALPGLREKDFGEWEGLTHQEVQSGYPLLYERMFEEGPGFAPPGGESDESFFRRISAIVEGIGNSRSNTDGNLLLVAHGGTLRAVIVELLGLPTESMWRFRLSNAGLSIVTVFGDGSGVLDLLNDTSHLGEGFDV